MITPEEALKIFKKHFPKTQVLWIREHKDFYSFERRTEDGHSYITGGIPIIDKINGSMYSAHIFKDRQLLNEFKKIDI
ncbi:PepSY domain-containing protein [Fibrobacter sp. UWB12]|jgi:hypothetical protein|uniref:PepSY domain-containing protein n=1 Tax=Fibrobacter sp. UWB12 TaxID=1896203 RepID=UPI00092006DD|nr:PepSY domain-containing protein [Fibrobacter sp. UWB12]SHK22368.1 hypothetical protein SAMN05720759_101200 [Fibrobacter sp. UWB12]